MMQHDRTDETSGNTQRLMRPADYARARHLHRSTICRQVASGVIPTHDGLINPVEADQARDSKLDPGRRMEFARRKLEKQQSVRCGSAPVDPGFDRGVQWLGQELSYSARSEWPAAVAKALEQLPAKARALVLAIAIELLEDWLAEYGVAPAAKTPIDFAVFGADAQVVEREMRSVLEELRDGTGNG